MGGIVPKCKSSRAVDALGSHETVGDRPGVWNVQYEAHGSCRNDKGYGGPLFVLTKNGRAGMRMFPELAEILPTQLRLGAASNSVVIRHTRLKLKMAYARLLPSAAKQLADAIDLCVAGH